MPRPTWDFFAFSFQVPSNALPKQSVPAASQTVRAIKVVLDFMAQMKPGFGRYVNAFVLFTADYTDVSNWGSDVSSSRIFATFNCQFSPQPTDHWSRVTFLELPLVFRGVEIAFRFRD